MKEVAGTTNLDRDFLMIANIGNEGNKKLFGANVGVNKIAQFNSISSGWCSKKLLKG